MVPQAWVKTEMDSERLDGTVPGKTEPPERATPE
ncbi:MAG: hypothetical protein DIJKHBIC_03748 [Thermoanaerobaculia bacterium]|nr:hypothetical protein [Thermoanaerobaculia bacterium]